MIGIKYFSIMVFVSMITIATWASLDSNVFVGGKHVIAHPWGIATLFDAYFAFLFFWLWLSYKENSTLKSLVWLILICTLGTIAASFYVLLQIFYNKHNTVEKLLVQRNKTS